MFCCLRRSVEASCHKQDSLMRGSAYSVSRDQQTPPLSGITYTPPLTCWWHPMVQHSSITKPELVENHDFCPSYEFHPVGILPRLVWKSSNDVAIPMVKKMLKMCLYLFVSTEYTNLTNRYKTNTTWQHASLMHSIARQKLEGRTCAHPGLLQIQNPTC